MDDKLITQFFNEMERNISFYKEFNDLEEHKLADIKENRFEKLDEYVKQEEVYVLRSRGLEASREKLLDAMGLSNKKMSEIIDYLPADQKEKGSDLYHELSDIIFRLQCANKKCITLSELRIQRIKQQIDTLSNGKNQENDSKQETEKTSISKIV